MKKYIIIALVSGTVLTSCGEYNKVLKSTDYEYKYEAAKSYFGKGQNTKAATILEELITIMKGTDKAEESLYMLGMTYYNQGDFITASHYFTTYYNTYPRGVYTEQARYFSGKALFLDTPEPRLDQSSTYKAIQELQMFMEYFPTSSRRQDAQQMIFDLQDKLVMKDYLAAKLYYDLGSYTGNSTYSTTGNNYLSCIVTAQNALKDYPYTKMREDLSILVLRAKYDMAKASVEEKKEELSRHFGYKFEIAPELQKMSYKATLRDESLNEFLAALDSITPQMSYCIDVNRKIVKVKKLNYGED